MIDGIGSSTTALTSALGEGDDQLGRDAFLKLLTAQLQFQDPLKPVENHQFVAELAQFSSLEQSMGINDRLDLLMAQTRGLANTEIVALVGKQATVKGSIVTVDGTGGSTPVNFSLAEDTAETRVQIRNLNGDVVRTLELGERDAGFVQISWDGRNDSGVLQPAGPYTISVEAKGPGDVPVSVSQETSGRVEAVSFDQGFPLLHLDNGISVPVSDLLKVEPQPPTP